MDGRRDLEAGGLMISKHAAHFCDSSDMMTTSKISRAILGNLQCTRLVKNVSHSGAAPGAARIRVRHVPAIA
jgi:hypothetical protein